MPDAISPLPIHIESDGPFMGIATITLEQPGKPVVVLDHPLIQRLEAAILSLPRTVAGVVLASASERVFVAGADLKAIAELNDAQLHAYLQYGSKVFGMLGQLPVPTAAAINGAALGGGLELAMHCDALIACPGAKPYPVGLPEAGLSICPGWGGTVLLPARLDPAVAMEKTAKGEPLMFDAAREAGMFDDLAISAAQLLTVAKGWIAKARARPITRDGAPARWLGRKAGEGVRALERTRDVLVATEPGKAVAMAIDAGVTRGWKAALEVEQRELVRLRSTPAGKAAIQGFFDKTKK
ncbi:MAG: enoyl-CoA hydratase/isomerase family protein [Phycisphaerales bacterium]|jgi:enoyl-CoA hydratase/carnithine racemase